jgi:hypothetical protein
MRSKISSVDCSPAAGERAWFPPAVRRRHAAHIVALILAVVFALFSPAAAVADDTFTQVSATPNPAANGQQVTVLASECDRSANVHPTGTITLTDVASSRPLATGMLGSVTSPFGNCAETSIVLPPLNAGQHAISAQYNPSGPVAVTASSTSYTQTWNGSDDTSTEVSATPNPAASGQQVTVLARECDRSANVHPTGTITVTDGTSGQQLGGGTLGSVASPFGNCADTTIVLPTLSAGQHTIVARYNPSGPVAVTASSASYNQTMMPVSTESPTPTEGPTPTESPTSPVSPTPQVSPRSAQDLGAWLGRNWQPLAGAITAFLTAIAGFLALWLPRRTTSPRDEDTPDVRGKPPAPQAVNGDKASEPTDLREARIEQPGPSPSAHAVLVGDVWRSSDGRWRWDGHKWVARDS